MLELASGARYSSSDTQSERRRRKGRRNRSGSESNYVAIYTDVALMDSALVVGLGNSHLHQ